MRRDGEGEGVGGRGGLDRVRRRVRRIRDAVMARVKRFIVRITGGVGWLGMGNGSLIPSSLHTIPFIDAVKVCF